MIKQKKLKNVILIFFNQTLRLKKLEESLVRNRAIFS